MKKIVLTIFIAVLAMPLLAAQQKIRIGTEGAYAPFNFIDPNGKVQGFDVDIARELCKEMKANCEFVTQAWDGIIPGLLYKKYDAIVASMSITKERAKKVLFSDPYYSSPARFMVPKGKTLNVTKEGLAGKKIAVQRGTIHVNYLEGEWSGVINKKEYDTQEEANMDLVAGRVDAVLADSTVLYGWMEKHGEGKFEFTGPALNDPKYFGEGAGIAFRKKDKDLVSKFNKALATIIADGRYDKIRAKYFPFDIKFKK